MADIFLSYSREDRERVAILVEAFTRRGWSVWWDSHIPVGKAFDEVIESQLSSARCAVVVWSATSVKSQWVRAEAGDALSRGLLVPVAIDEVQLPLEFRRIQTAEVGEPGSPGFEDRLRPVLEAIAAHISAAPALAPAPVSRPAAPPPVSVAPASGGGVSWRIVLPLLLALLAVGGWLAFGGGRSPAGDEPAKPTVQPESEPTVEEKKDPPAPSPEPGKNDVKRPPGIVTRPQIPKDLTLEAKPSGDSAEPAPSPKRPTVLVPIDGKIVARTLDSAAPLEVGGDVEAPVIKKMQLPQLSDEAIKAKIRGSVRVRAIIETNGNVSSVELVRGFSSSVDPAALAAAKLWKFQPATRNGQPVRVAYEFDVPLRIAALPGTRK